MITDWHTQWILSVPIFTVRVSIRYMDRIEGHRLTYCYASVPCLTGYPHVNKEGPEPEATYCSEGIKNLAKMLCHGEPHIAKFTSVLIVHNMHPYIIL